MVNDIKAELKSISILERKIKDELEELEYLNSLKTSIKSFNYDKDKVKSSPKRKDFTDTIVKITELEEIITKNINRLVSIRAMAIKSFNILPDNLKDIMKLKYLYSYSFNEISKKTGYTLRHIFRLHGEALQILRKELEV